MGQITAQMTVLEILCQHRQTEQVFRRLDAAAGICICCQGLFDSLEELSHKYNLDLKKLLDELETVVDAEPNPGNS